MNLTGNITASANAIEQLLQSAKVIAVVGHSDDPSRTSYRIAQFLRNVGYKVYPVNPTVSEIDGQRSYASVAEIPEHVDIVNVFRRPSFVPEVVEDAIEAGADAIWTQLGVVHEEALQKAVDAGLKVVEDRCIKIEHVRLNVGASR